MAPLLKSALKDVKLNFYIFPYLNRIAYRLTHFFVAYENPLPKKLRLYMNKPAVFP